MDEVGRDILKEIKTDEGPQKGKQGAGVEGVKTNEDLLKKISGGEGSGNKDPLGAKVVEGKQGVDVKGVKPLGDVRSEKSGKLLVSSDGGEKREMTPAQADAEANSALAAAQKRIEGIPGAKAWMEEAGGGTREVKTYVPDEFKSLYDSRK